MNGFHGKESCSSHLCRDISLSGLTDNPGHITKNIPYSLGYRLRRLESKDENLERNLQVLKEELIYRQYRASVVDAALDRVRQLRRSDTLVKVARVPTERVVLSVPYDKRLPDVSSVLKHRWTCLVDRDARARDYMAAPPMVAYSRPPNLRAADQVHPSSCTPSAASSSCWVHSLQEGKLCVLPACRVC